MDTLKNAAEIAGSVGAVITTALLMFAEYKALKGNSFMDEITEEVKKWEVVS